MDKPRAILLLSGGLDSVAAAYLVRDIAEPVLALTMDYGQKAGKRELGAAYAVAQRLGIPHRTLFLPFLREAAGGAMVDPTKQLPSLTAEELDDVDGAARASAAAVWIPNRNGALIAVAATWAEANDAAYVVCGFNREEAQTFPDNSAGFIEATNRALALSTRNGVQVVAPTIDMDKTEIVRRARAAGAPLDLCWSCYLGGDDPCGRCESCLRFRRAFDAADAEALRDR
ncbi:MAG: 7-cyano-7-deazaguanine synthase QueC [Planctomycetes bacterium]|nr:7-cyano-7-deazaguanine synthase QueC [Planctomycetota bacterium]